MNAGRYEEKPITIGGISRSTGAWSRVSGISKSTIYRRLKNGWPPERAVFGDAVLNGQVVKKARRPLPPPVPRGISTFPMGAVRSFPLEALDLLRRVA